MEKRKPRVASTKRRSKGRLVSGQITRSDIFKLLIALVRLATVVLMVIQ